MMFLASAAHGAYILGREKFPDKQAAQLLKSPDPLNPTALTKTL